MVENRRMWDSHWRKGAFHNKEHKALINTCIAIFGYNLSGLKVLEVGSGRGVDSVKLAQLGAVACMVDYSKPSFDLSTALASAKGAKVNPVLADASLLPFRDETFDLVFSQGIMEHGSNLGLLTEQARVVKTGGYVIVDVPQLYSLQAVIKAIQIKLRKWPYGDEKSFSKRDVEQMLSHVGLIPVSSYGWGVFPILNMGIRSLFRRSNAIKDNSMPNTLADTRTTFMDRLEQSFLASLIMNNVGVIGKKNISGI